MHDIATECRLFLIMQTYRLLKDININLFHLCGCACLLRGEEIRRAGQKLKTEQNGQLALLLHFCFGISIIDLKDLLSRQPSEEEFTMCIQ